MTPSEITPSALTEMAQSLRDRSEPFAFATVVRTVGSTAAKPGSKALIGADGTILEGFLGGGCARGAVKRATLKALESGAPLLISVAPEEALDALGVEAGVSQDGVTYARNGCPSKGTIDIFIEPCLPLPTLAIIGESPVARALAQIAPQFSWSLAVHESSEDLSLSEHTGFVVIATQGQGDLVALEAALAANVPHISFVGSARKFATLAEKLIAKGADQKAVAQINAPAGVEINAVTPEEIAISILADLVRQRRAPTQEPADDV